MIGGLAPLVHRPIIAYGAMPHRGNTIAGVEVTESAAEQALRTVQQNPAAALRLATAVITDPADDGELVRAHWAAGLAHRELDDLEAACAEIERARDLAVSTSGPPALLARILVSLALVHAFDGRIRNALALLDDAEPIAEGVDRAHLLMQRGIVLYWLGHLEEAVTSYDAALAVLASHEDHLVEARLRVNYGAVLSFHGDLDAAAEHLRRAHELAVELGQTLVAGTAVHNLGHVLAVLGDLPAAFEAFTRAADLYTSAAAGSTFLDNLRIDHARSLIAANLLEEAMAVLAPTLASARGDPPSTVAGDAYFVAAQIEMAREDPAAAARDAAASHDAFARAGRTAWAVLADGVALGVRALAEPSSEVAVDAVGAATVLDAMGYRPDATRSLVIAARVLERIGALDAAGDLLHRIRRRRPSALDRMVVAQVAAGCAVQRGAPGQARRHLREGLRTVAENADALGAIELRARAAANAEQLAKQGVELAIADGRAREFVEYVEATRLMRASMSDVRPPRDPALAELLAELRRTVHELRSAEPGDARTELERRRATLEESVREHTRRQRGGDGPAALSVREALDALGGYDLLEYFELDGRLLAASVVGRRAALHDLGATAGLREDIDGCAFALHRLNRRTISAASIEAAYAVLGDLGRSVVQRVMPARVRRSDHPLVVVPSGPIAGFPWGVAAPFIGRPVAVAPSLRSWIDAARRGSPLVPGARVLLAAGPDLPGAVAEIAALRGLYEDPATLTGAAATAEQTLQALDGCRLAHLACHGSFRSDSPMFSTLSFADGPLTVYDLEGSRTTPETFVLSACDVGSSAVLRGGTLLGLSSALMAFGAAAVVAPLTPVNDHAAVGAMAAVHKALLAGRSAAEAVAETTATSLGDDAWATAAAFIALGA
jgi:tetratricopeptide (TPR) repeat protein